MLRSSPAQPQYPVPDSPFSLSSSAAPLPPTVMLWDNCSATLPHTHQRKQPLLPQKACFPTTRAILSSTQVINSIWDHHAYNMPKKCKKGNFFVSHIHRQTEFSLVQVRAPQALGFSCWNPPLETGLANKRDTLFLISQSQMSKCWHSRHPSSVLWKEQSCGLGCLLGAKILLEAVFEVQTFPT